MDKAGAIGNSIRKIKSRGERTPLSHPGQPFVTPSPDLPHTLASTSSHPGQYLCHTLASTFVTPSPVLRHTLASPSSHPHQIFLTPWLALRLTLASTFVTSWPAPLLHPRQFFVTLWSALRHTLLSSSSNPGQHLCPTLTSTSSHPRQLFVKPWPALRHTLSSSLSHSCQLFVTILPDQRQAFVGFRKTSVTSSSSPRQTCQS
ncbi:hypothetical protein PoB_002081700 [Plakobranchus ocellatus]|uniref:Uncharacterized protein n=1 Tax=Plakobranchus ocellatus TaxID=259542 RepID=A0AAV3ZIE4_9GAST|nr:hypothetical protein PoB_002081700 [Plakobranchus ocellatus]